MIKLTRRQKTIFVIGIIIGFLVPILVKALFINTLAVAKVSESGVTVLLEADRPVEVPKGFVITGNACEIVDLGGDKFIDRDLTTPFVVQKKITVKCAEGTTTICVIYFQERYTNYFHEEMVKKILK